ncbi:MAG: DUF4004 family protein [Clostridia bacterium]|nr:DUF4004 family protein [Clostridia bacterium]
MPEDLISKKELLERFAISYGALYRWKRMGLIPEDWFIKKTTVTGQETFFPRELITQRVEWIQTHKDDASLDDLAKTLNKAEEKKSYLTIRTPFGDRSFELGDIQTVLLDSRDVTREILDLLNRK